MLPPQFERFLPMDSTHFHTLDFIIGSICQLTVVVLICLFFPAKASISLLQACFMDIIDQERP